MTESHLSVAAPNNDRPILGEAKKKSLIALVGTVVAAAVSFGVISPDLADSINSGWAYILGAIMTLIPLVTSLLHAVGIVKGAEKKTTPVDSPVDAGGNTLVPLSALDLDTATGEPANDPNSAVDAVELDDEEVEIAPPVEPDPTAASTALTALVTAADPEPGRHSTVDPPPSPG